MGFQGWILAVGIVASLPVFGYSVYNQWSSRPGALGRMIAGLAVFAAIILATMLTAYLVGIWTQ